MGKACILDTSGLYSFGANTPGWISNLGLVYGADATTGRLKITAADGTNLSNTNKAWVTMPSTVAGELVRIKVDYTTHEHYFEDDTASVSDIVGEQFGVTTGVAWGEDRPFFLYAVNSDDTAAGLAFAISPNPAATVSPATANSGYHGNPGATPSDRNFFYLTDTNVTITHAAKPVLLIGSIRMRMSSSDDWTVQTLGNTDGIGPDALRKTFATEWRLPSGQMGAASGTWIHSNGGTAPTYTANQSVRYRIGADGFVDFMYNLSNSSGGTAGNGAGTLRIALPYVANAHGGTGLNDIGGSGYVLNSGVLDLCFIHQTITGSSYTLALYQSTIVTGVNQLVLNSQNNTTRLLQGTIRYKAF